MFLTDLLTISFSFTNYNFYLIPMYFLPSVYYFSLFWIKRFSYKFPKPHDVFNNWNITEVEHKQQDQESLPPSLFPSSQVSQVSPTALGKDKTVGPKA